MKRIVAFDFDGTITCSDTLFDFIKYTFGRCKLYKSLLLNAYNLLLFVLGIRDNEKAKEKLLGSLLRGIKERDFTTMCKKYSKNRIPQIIRKETYKKIEEHRQKGDILIIVSASPEDWIKPWALSNGFSHILATQLECKDGKLTGSFASKNCYGKEKVNRIIAEFSNRANIHITAYGDSNGDVDMLKYADEGYLIRKNKWINYKQ